MRKLRSQVGRLFFPRRGQREIGKGSVLAAEAPLSLPMPNENNLGPRRAHGASFKQDLHKGRETTGRGPAIENSGLFGRNAGHPAMIVAG